MVLLHPAAFGAEKRAKAIGIGYFGRWFGYITGHIICCSQVGITTNQRAK